MARKNKARYVYIHDPTHPRAMSNGYIGEHVLVCEHALGKHLPPGAIPHHVDENRAKGGGE